MFWHQHSIQGLGNSNSSMMNRDSVKEEITCRMAAFSPSSHDRDNTTTTSQPSALLGPDKVTAALPTFQKEVDVYFAEKVVSREVNPLVWWKDNNVCFPNLAKVASYLSPS